jgi:hypothetical protein
MVGFQRQHHQGMKHTVVPASLTKNSKLELWDPAAVKNGSQLAARTINLRPWVGTTHSTELQPEWPDDLRESDVKTASSGGSTGNPIDQVIWSERRDLNSRPLVSQTRARR